MLGSPSGAQLMKFKNKFSLLRPRWRTTTGVQNSVVGNSAVISLRMPASLKILVIFVREDWVKLKYSSPFSNMEAENYQ